MITRTWEVGTTVNYAPPCLAESEACRLFNHTVQPTKFQIGNTPGNLRSKNDINNAMGTTLKKFCTRYEDGNLLVSFPSLNISSRTIVSNDKFINVQVKELSTRFHDSWKSHVLYLVWLSLIDEDDLFFFIDMSQRKDLKRNTSEFLKEKEGRKKNKKALDLQR